MPTWLRLHFLLGAVIFALYLLLGGWRMLVA